MYYNDPKSYNYYNYPNFNPYTPQYQDTTAPVPSPMSMEEKMFTNEEMDELADKIAEKVVQKLYNQTKSNTEPMLGGPPGQNITPPPETPEGICFTSFDCKGAEYRCIFPVICGDFKCAARYEEF